MNHLSIAVCTLLFAAASAGAQTLNLKAPIADKPALLTSSGQSADIEMVKPIGRRSVFPNRCMRGCGSDLVVIDDGYLRTQ